MHELIQTQRVNNVARHPQPHPTQLSGFPDQFLIRASREVYIDLGTLFFVLCIFEAF